MEECRIGPVAQVGDRSRWANGTVLQRIRLIDRLAVRPTAELDEIEAEMAATDTQLSGEDGNPSEVEILHRAASWAHDHPDVVDVAA